MEEDFLAGGVLPPSQSYQYNVEDLLLRFGAGDPDKPERIPIEAAADFLTGEVEAGKISFPYQKYHSSPPEELFRGIRETPLNAQQPDSYRLYSYYPRHGMYWKPSLFRGLPLVLGVKENSYVRADVLSDLYVEDLRVEAKRFDQEKGVRGHWLDRERLRPIMLHALSRYQVITPRELRQSVYHCVAETKTFRPTLAKSVLLAVFGLERPREKHVLATPRRLEGLKWLDISAGWGDRLLTAMALKMEYLGFDPNVKLQPRYRAMVESFGSPAKHRVVPLPFENAPIGDFLPPGAPECYFDVVFSSPPFFDVEEYVPGQAGQSIVSYPELTGWLVHFLFASLRNAWGRLKPGGFLVIHMGDTKPSLPNGGVQMSELMNLFIEEQLPLSSWEGVIGLEGQSGYPRPVWVWKKCQSASVVRRWTPGRKRSITWMYPKVAEEMGLR